MDPVDVVAKVSYQGQFLRLRFPLDASAADVLAALRSSNLAERAEKATVRRSASSALEPLTDESWRVAVNEAKAAQTSGGGLLVRLYIDPSNDAAPDSRQAIPTQPQDVHMQPEPVEDVVDGREYVAATFVQPLTEQAFAQPVAEASTAPQQATNLWPHQAFQQQPDIMTNTLPGTPRSSLPETPTRVPGTPKRSRPYLEIMTGLLPGTPSVLPGTPGRVPGTPTRVPGTPKRSRPCLTPVGLPGTSARMPGTPTRSGYPRDARQQSTAFSGNDPSGWQSSYGHMHCGALYMTDGVRRYWNSAMITGPLFLSGTEMLCEDCSITGPVTLQNGAKLTMRRGRQTGPITVAQGCSYENQGCQQLGPIFR
mmetsp:Transcript_27010/g.62812  ORF Transcript_27010/g.62812 Transcript_27010/m.62812 type:complete len:367 (+) Transcript_27010:143-1243(+)